MRRQPKADVVICGLGWAGSIMLSELASTGLSIVGFERGGRVSPAPGLRLAGLEQDDLAPQRGALMQDLTREGLTFRHRPGQRAQPLRRPTSFLTGEVLGGAGVTWNGIMTRYLPRDFRPRSELADRSELKAIPADMMLQDFGVTYAELEADYDRFEAVTGTSGRAGNVQGRILPGGNPFEGPRSREYPNPPLADCHAGVLFRDAAEGLGYHPYPVPAANASQPYVNPHGLTMGACVYCGFCDRFRCPVDAKGSPHNTLLPYAESFANVDVRTHSRVLRVQLTPDGKHATGVEYVDARGELNFQPADLVVLSGYTFSNVHLMLLSGIGRPYDRDRGEGIVGRSYAYHVRGGALAFFDEDVHINGFMGSGGLGVTIDDFNADAFDSLRHGFLGGAMIGAEASGARPIRHLPVPEGTPRWGMAWKEAVVRHYNHTARLSVCGASMAYRDNYLDLDPGHRDEWGRPLLRLTFDLTPNEIALSRFMTDRSVEIAQAMGAPRIDAKPSAFPYDVSAYQGSHNTGGAIMGSDPGSSAVNASLQSWDVPNVFVVGGSAFPQLPGKNPTATIGALAYRAGAAIRESYLRSGSGMVG